MSALDDVVDAGMSMFKEGGLVQDLAREELEDLREAAMEFCTMYTDGQLRGPDSWRHLAERILQKDPERAKRAGLVVEESEGA